MILELLLTVLRDVAYALAMTLAVAFCVGAVAMVWLSCWIIFENLRRARRGEADVVLLRPTVEPGLARELDRTLTARAARGGRS